MDEVLNAVSDVQIIGYQRLSLTTSIEIYIGYISMGSPGQPGKGGAINRAQHEIGTYVQSKRKVIAVLLTVMILAILGPVFGILVEVIYKIMYYRIHKDAPPSIYERDVFILATSGWYLFMVSLLFDWVTRVAWSSS